MKSLSYKQFVRLKCSEKDGSLLKLSQLKRENPDEFNSYNASFEMAFDRIIRANNTQTAKMDGGYLITEKTILANSSVVHPDKTYEELRACK